MRTIIRPADLPQYVAGEIWLDAVDGRWSELSIRGYKYKPSDISAPRLPDYLIVLYTGGPTQMRYAARSQKADQRRSRGLEAGRPRRWVSQLRDRALMADQRDHDQAVAACPSGSDRER